MHLGLHCVVVHEVLSFSCRPHHRSLSRADKEGFYIDLMSVCNIIKPYYFFPITFNEDCQHGD